MNINSEEFKTIVNDVLGQLSNVKHFSLSGNTLLIDFIGRRRGAPWQAAIDFDDACKATTVFCQNGSTAPSWIARTITEIVKNHH